MPFFRFAPQSDNRRSKEATAPINLVNCVVKKTPADSPWANKAPFFIAPTPGRTLRATMPENVRGLFSSPGCRGGNLLVAAGSNLYESASSTLAYSTVGALAGGDVVTMRAFRANLVLRAFGQLKYYTGSAFTQVTDESAPDFATTCAVVGQRLIAAFEDNDVWGWSKAGDPLDWDPNGQANDADLPDPIVGQEEIGLDLWSFNSRSTQIWQATGGAESAAFSRVPGVNIKVGLAARAAFAPMGAGGMLLGVTDKGSRAVYGTRGYDLVPVENLSLESALKTLTPSDVADAVAWSYGDGAKEFWGLNLGLPGAHVFDAEMSLWHERRRYGMDEYDIDFVANAFGMTLAASRQSPKIWSLDDDVYTDDGDPIIREFTAAIPASGDVPVDRLVWLFNTRDTPLEGQGSEPVMMVSTSNDNGQTWSDEREIPLPTASNRFRVQDWGWGLASAEHGMLIKHRISDPFGFAAAGLYVNPTPEELNA